MQDEELDKIINDAARQHHPAYDDEAWGKMQALLDKHMPQKKDRKRPFIFWLLFLLLGGTAVTLIMQRGGQTSTTNKPAVAGNSTAAYNTKPANENVTPEKKSAAVNTIESKNNSALPKNYTGTTSTAPAAINNTAATQPAASNSTATVNTSNRKPVLHKKGRTAVKIKKTAAADNEDYYTSDIEQKKFAAKTRSTVKAATAYEDDEKNTGEQHIANTNTKTEVKKDNTTDTALSTAKQKDTIAVKPETAATNTTVQKQRSNKKFKNNFVLTVSGGFDKSFIQTANPGKTKFTYGIGAGYIFNKRIRVNTGFFVSRKVYDAKPTDYKFPYGTQYPYLWMINADCMVYEIPVNFYYNFAAAKKHNWFAGGGLSTVLMKKELYNYNYKTPTGQFYNYEHTYTNENKHLFSVLTLSGGYQYNISSRIQFMAEPYFKIPLSGIGAGAINLKSGGILFTAAIKPFAKK